MADLQALAARGAAAFAGNGSAADYLSYVFSRLVEGSDANRFYQGGAAQRSELGSLAAGSSPELLDKLLPLPKSPLTYSLIVTDGNGVTS